KNAAAISLTTVIATSSAVSAERAGKQLINLRLGMLLEVATVAGSLMGGVTAQVLPQSTLQKLFGIVAAVIAVVMLSRLQRRNVRSEERRVGKECRSRWSSCREKGMKTV